MLDFENDSVFQLASLTAAINRIPMPPSRLSNLLNIDEEGVNTITLGIETLQGSIELIPFTERNAPASTLGKSNRRAVPIRVPQMKVEDAINASEIQGVRMFGTDNELESAAAVLNTRMEHIRKSFLATEEFHRFNMLTGLVVDPASSGNSTVASMYSALNIATPTAVDFTLGTTTSDIEGLVMDIKTSIERALGGLPYDHIHVLCSQRFFKRLKKHPVVAAAYQYWNQGAFGRTDMRRSGFEIDGVVFEMYEVGIGGKPFIQPDYARAFPVGAPIYHRRNAPADFMETVNTIGLPSYAKTEPMRMNRGINLHVQSNPLFFCSHPDTLISLYTSD